MKKKLIIALGVLALLGVCATTLLAYNANKIIVGYKAEIEQIASQALSARVKIGKLDVNVFPSASVLMRDLHISPSGMSKASGILLKELSAAVPLFPLLGGTVTVQKLSLKRPSLTLLKTKEGIIIDGLQGLSKPAKTSVKQTQPGKRPANKKSGDTATAAPLPDWFHFELSEFSIQDAALAVKDPDKADTLSVQPFNLQTDLRLEGAQVHIQDLSFDAQINQVLPIRAQGKNIALNLKSLDVALEKLKFIIEESALNAGGNTNLNTLTSDLKITSDGIDLEPIGRFAARLKPDLPITDLTGSLSPELSITSSNTHPFNAQGTLSLNSIGLTSGEITISDLSGPLTVEANDSIQKVTTDSLRVRIKDEPIKLALALRNSAGEFSFPAFAIEGFAGTIKSSGTLLYTDKRMPLRNELHLATIDIERLLNAVKPALAELVSGVLTSFTSQIKVDLGAENITQTLSGGGQLLLENGELKQINLARSVLGAVQGLPFLTGSLEDSVPDEERESLKENRTTINSLNASFKIGDSQVNLTRFQLANPRFDLFAHGTVGFDTELKLTTRMVFTEEFSAKLVHTTRELRNLLNSDEQIVIPLMLTGKIMEVRILPDIDELLKLAAGKAIEKKAGKLLEKLTGDDGEGAGKALGNILGF